MELFWFIRPLKHTQHSVPAQPVSIHSDTRADWGLVRKQGYFDMLATGGWDRTTDCPICGQLHCPWATVTIDVAGFSYFLSFVNDNYFHLPATLLKVFRSVLDARSFFVSCVLHFSCHNDADGDFLDVALLTVFPNLKLLLHIIYMSLLAPKLLFFHILCIEIIGPLQSCLKHLHLHLGFLFFWT